MKAYLAIKFKEDYSNRPFIEDLSRVLKDVGIITEIMVRDHERWGEKIFSPKELMQLTFEAIDNSNILIIEFSEKGVGLGIEAGYAFAKRKPIIVIAKEDASISSTLSGIANNIIFYKDISELGIKILDLV
jgi:2'-deoxynucleoside 5'-phosphate N-hydrolase